MGQPVPEEAQVTQSLTACAVPPLSSVADSNTPKIAAVEEESPKGVRPPGSSSVPTTFVNDLPDSTDRQQASEGVTVAVYDILGVLGRGGMGIVYKARQMALNRIVAIKMILHAGPEGRERFEREAQAIARLNHPNIVPIYEVGEHNGLPFFSLEYCAGGSLAGKLNGNPMPPREAAHLIETLARAIHAAHQARVIHRDLKPHNILLTADGIPKITDFGVARDLDVVSQTESGDLLGTPCYMAPEQANRKGVVLTSAVDVYGLGAILYELLTGRPPFKAATVIETVMQVKNDEPARPRHLNPSTPRDLETICLKCLQKDPSKRYATARDLAEDCVAFLEGGAIKAQPIGLWTKALRWARRRPRDAALIAVSALALVSSLTGVMLYQNQQLRAAARQRREFVRLETARQKIGELLDQNQHAAAAGDWTGAKIAAANALTMLASDSTLQEYRTRSETAFAEADRHLKEDAARRNAHAQLTKLLTLREEALFHGLARLSSLDLPLPASQETARQTAREALTLFGLATPDGPSAVRQNPYLSAKQKNELLTGAYEVFLVLAAALARPLPTEDVRTQARQALTALEQAGNVRQPTRAYFLGKATYLEQLGQRADAEIARRKALELTPTCAIDHFLMGEQCYRDNQFRQAIAHFDAALRLEPDYFCAQYLIALCYLGEGEPGRANARLTPCLQRRADSVWLYILRGFGYAELGERLGEAATAQVEFEAADADYRQAQEILARQPDSDAQYALLVNRGILRLRQKDLAEAIKDLKEAITLYPDRFSAYVNLAQVYQKQGHLEEARKQLDHAIGLQPALAALYRLRARLLEKDHRRAALADLDQVLKFDPVDSAQRASDQVERARLLYLEGRYAEVEQAVAEALRLRPDDALAHRLQGQVLLELKRYPEAEAAFSRCLEQALPRKTLAEVHQARGLARASRGRFDQAITDYTVALNNWPSARTYIDRGWAYLINEAPLLAKADFEAALALDAQNGDAYAGRGIAQAKRGQYQLAVQDADQALRVGPRNDRLVYNAARVYALAAAAVQISGPGTEVKARILFDHYARQAVTLIREAIEHLPELQRSTFWRDTVHEDAALNAIRRTTAFEELAAAYAQRRP
jgi:serine/threonine protein kinase/Tfp pilus assembly protein PilF